MIFKIELGFKICMIKNLSKLETIWFLVFNIYAIMYLGDSMKKTMILIIVIFSMCGCNTKNDRFADFEYYDLSDKNEMVKYSFVDFNKKKNYTYAFAVLSDFYEGLFYKINNNEEEYILLEEMRSCYATTEYKDKQKTRFYENKLYTLRCMGNSIIEFTLDEENTTKKELHFDTTKISDKIHYVMFNSIEKIDEENIYYTGTFANTDRFDVPIKCSLTDYVCEEVKE